MRPTPQRPAPDGLTLLSFGLLAALALLLLRPLFGLGLPPVWLIALILAARLGVQLLRARRNPLLRRPAALVLDVALIGLLLWSAFTREAQ